MEYEGYVEAAREALREGDDRHALTCAAIAQAQALGRIADLLGPIACELGDGNVKLAMIAGELEQINSTLVAAQNDSPVQVRIWGGLGGIEGAILALASTIHDK